MSLFNEFLERFDVWPVVRPYIHLIVDEDEIALVVAMAGEELTVDEVAARLSLPVDQAAALLQRAYSRCVVNKSVDDGMTRYAAADLYARLDHFAKFENWEDIPTDDRRAITRRYLDAFIDRHRANIERKMQGLAAPNALPNDTVLLLPEVEAMIDAATDIIVQPCDCRRLGQNCQRPVETCLWFDEGARKALDRGHGRRLTRDEAKKLVRRADMKGLMHTGDSEWQSRGLHAVCNCCACDCFPFRAAQELGAKGVWPKSHYVAVHDLERCTHCGACVRRCHFAAFTHGEATITVKGVEHREVLFDPQLCWGCGLCANTCPFEAITMQPLDPAP